MKSDHSLIQKEATEIPPAILPTRCLFRVIRDRPFQRAERRPNLHLTSPAVGFKWNSKRVVSKIGVSRQSKLAALLPKLMLR